MKLSRLFVLLASLAAGSAQATIITFESGLDPTFTYSGVDVATVPIGQVSGYNNVAAATASSRVAYNPYAVSPSNFYLAGLPTSVFTLNSFVIAGAWGTQTLTVQGLNDGALLYSSALAISLTPTTFLADWVGIDQLRILIGNDYVPTPGVSGAGQHWALDNLRINEAITVPEPATLFTFALGLLALGLLRKRVRVRQ